MSYLQHVLLAHESLYKKSAQLAGQRWHRCRIVCRQLPGACRRRHCAQRRSGCLHKSQATTLRKLR